ncbi:unnamed protein product [Strongylus vulgaris]|uniref:Uncharacterized protein n=1 Tax=Strongylus vulgaris TaxID=40348 RepID=A0A3P7LM52_STRVU|nr:unnamed protein product [Strongylus vulgaris]
MFYVRVLIGSIILFAIIALTVFGIPWIIYSSEWRLEQDSIQKRFISELKWEQSRMTLSDQVTKVLQDQKLPKTEVEDIIIKYVDTYYPNLKSIPSYFSDQTYWTYSASIWFVICQTTSLQAIKELEVFSVATHLLALYNKLLGPCIVIAIVGVSLYSSHSQTDFFTALRDLLAIMSLTIVFGSDMYAYGSRDSVMEVLYWSCLVFLANSALAAAIASIIRAYVTWLNIEEVVATPKELMRNLEKEKKERKNQLVYHDKSE